MFKSLIFLLLRAALGFSVITAIILATTSRQVFSQDSLTASGSPVYVWFYLATMIAWLAGCVLAIGEFCGFAGEKFRRPFAWAPVWMPSAYALASYLWLTQVSGY